MPTLLQFWTSDELDDFRREMAELVQTPAPEVIPTDPDFARLHWGDRAPAEGQRRWVIPEHMASSRHIMTRLGELLPGHHILPKFCAQYLPATLHADSFDLGDPGGLTCLIPLDADAHPGDKTLLFEDRVQVNAQISQYLAKYDRSQPSPYDHTSRFALGHSGGNPPVCDWLKLLEVFQYRSGDMLVFERQHLHCSTDWIRLQPERQVRNFVLIVTVGSIPARYLHVAA